MKDKKIHIRNLVLIFFCLYSLFFIIGSTLAPVAAYLKYYNLSAKLTYTFIYSCHQQPDRSFWLLGYPIALCCRCYGFYIGTDIYGLCIIFNKLKINLASIIIIFAICLIDIIINLIFKINSGNITRFIAGIFLGIVFISVVDYMFTGRGKIEENN